MIPELILVTSIMSLLIAFYFIYEIYSIVGIVLIIFAMAFISVWLFPVVFLGLFLYWFMRYILLYEKQGNWWLKTCDLCEQKPILIMMERDMIIKMRCKEHVE